MLCWIEPLLRSWFDIKSTRHTNDDAVQYFKNRIAYVPGHVNRHNGNVSRDLDIYLGFRGSERGNA